MMMNFQSILDYLIGVLYVYLRPLIKWFLRRTTHLCELQRVVYATSPGAERTLGVEKSFKQSRSPVLKKISTKMNGLAIEGKFAADNCHEVTSLVEFACEAVCLEKRIKTTIHHRFLNGLRVSLLQMFGYRQLITEVEQLRMVAFDSSIGEHEVLLNKLWTELMPNRVISARRSKEWEEIGFQGEDPATDFRGMGLLGLQQLVFFATRFPDSARLVLSHSHHPVHGYPFACTGINLTHLAWTLLREGDLKTHFFNARQSTFALEDFHLVYCHIFCVFDEMWMATKLQDVMEFRFIKQRFTSQLKERLATDYRTVLAFEPPIETI